MGSQVGPHRILLQGKLPKASVSSRFLVWLVSVVRHRSLRFSSIITGGSSCLQGAEPTILFATLGGFLLETSDHDGADTF